MRQGTMGLDSKLAANWRRQLVAAFVMTAVIPILTLVYFLASYVWPYAVTVESIILIVAFNILLAACGFALLVKELEKRTIELRKKVTELDSLINNIPDMVWLADPDSRFSVVNKAFGTAVGLAPGRLLSRSYEACFGVEAARRFRDDDVKTMETGR